MGGHISLLSHKIIGYLTDNDDYMGLSYFENQQKMSYSKQIGKKCLQHLVDIGGFAHFDSLKKIHKYLHPALKYYHYFQQNIQHIGQDKSEDRNFMYIHQQQLISSAGGVLQLYCVFLSRVVPANISYFHFMREKDFYIHYNALKYIIQVGQMGTTGRAASRNLDVFSRLSVDNRLLFVKLISHWLYDMVKYRCSAIYLESKTLPHLIVFNAIVLIGLLDCERTNLLEQYRRKEKNDIMKGQIYQHCLYAFTYILSQTHPDKRNSSSQGNDCLQNILLATSKLINSMWRDYDKNQIVQLSKKTMFSPSYWYVNQIGFISHPNLERITFLLILDIILKINTIKQGEEDIKNNEKIYEMNVSSSKEIKKGDKYQIFDDEQELEQKPKIKKKISNQKLINQQQEISNQRKEDHLDFTDQQNMQTGINSQMMLLPSFGPKIWQKPYLHINNLTHIMLYHTLTSIIAYFPQFLQTQKLQRTLAQQIKTLKPNSFVRPYVLEIINLLNQKFVKPIQNKSDQIEGSGRHVQKQKSNVKILGELLQYSKNNQMDYSTQNYIIPYSTVGKNCHIFLNKFSIKTRQNYKKQLSRSDGQIWGQVLKYNIHQFIDKTK